jgi:uncharacterized membrane protein YheB (UPF0754 family)
MSKKIYKTAMGKTVDLGSLILQNENVKAVGNMNVNARGDVVDSANRVIDKKNSQIQRQHNRQVQSNVQERPVHTGTRQAKATQSKINEVVETVLPDLANSETEESPSVNGGLASALSKATKTS